MEDMYTIATEAPASKKSRASTEHTIELVADALRPPLQESQILWLADGNLFLRSQGFMFRIHESILKMHSTVFADELALPPPDSQYMVVQRVLADGFPVALVDVTDSHLDWRILLGVLYNTSL